MVASLSSGYTVFMGGITSPQFEGDETYENLLCANMDFLTDTNGCKWRNALNDDFAHCTKALEFAQECGMDYRLAVLVAKYLLSKLTQNPYKECGYAYDR